MHKGGVEHGDGELGDGGEQRRWAASGGDASGASAAAARSRRRRRRKRGSKRRELTGVGNLGGEFAGGGRGSSETWTATRKATGAAARQRNEKGIEWIETGRCGNLVNFSNAG